jgi:hypothetical protein
MDRREKTIKGLEHCDFGISTTCYEKECPYYQSHDCTDELKNDIIVLLKEQEPLNDDEIFNYLSEEWGKSPCSNCQEFECDGCKYAEEST